MIQVKEAIRKERHKNQMETRKTLNKMRSGGGGGGGSHDPLAGGNNIPLSQKLGMFPPLNVKGANLHLVEPRQPSQLANIEMKKVRYKTKSKAVALFISDKFIILFYSFIYTFFFFNIYFHR